MGGGEEWSRMFARSVRDVLEGLSLEFEQLQEIRMRVDAPLFLWYGNREYGVTKGGQLGQAGREGLRRISERELRETVECMGNYSLYAFEDEIRQGFLTVRGGHRVGLAGKAVMENGNLKTLKYISALNVRFAHQIKGCGEKVLPFLFEGERLCHSLLISPPRGGKTTLLRDLVRLLSDGTGTVPGRNVGVVDERGEIGACYQGIPQNDLGARTDVLDCCPKALGMMMLIRSMAPQVVAVDEIGSREDLEAVEYAAGCGCAVLATAHGGSLEEILGKPRLGALVRGGLFGRLVLLGNGEQAGRVREIRDGEGRLVWNGSSDG